jgi:ABC-type nitrate/sulfonate/bicarbonate transport system substrate-binding protein
MQRVRQILFVPPAPIVWAGHLDAFGRHGLEVETTQTVSSDQIGQGLAAGTWDVGVGVVDNILAWNALFGADLRISMQLERSQPMAFCGVPEVTSLEQAARGTVAVDATSNGFVLVLYRALAKAGIDRATVRFETVGGVRQRFEALCAGAVDATMLVPPFVDLALARGCTLLFDGRDHAPAYPGVVVASSAAWMRDTETLDAYRQALIEANRWAADPAHDDAAIAALTDARYSPLAARRLVGAIVPGLEVSREGWRETVELRREAGLLDGPEPRFEDIVLPGARAALPDK